MRPKRSKYKSYETHYKRRKITPRRMQKILHFSLLIIAVIFVCFQLATCINKTAAPPVPESSVEKSSVPESSVEDSSTPESSVEDSSTPESSVEDSSIPESSVEDSSIPESSVEDSSIPESSVEDSSIPESSVEDSSVPESSVEDSSIPESSVEDSSIPESSVEDSSIPESSVEDSSSTDPKDPHVYFKGTAFMGNSLIAGFDVYNIEPSADYYWSIGMSAYGALHSPMSGSENTAVEEICTHKYKKVFLMFGTNELGWSDSGSFIKNYGEVIDEIRTAMPETQIYIQSITPVTASVDKKNQNGINNARIEEYNILLQNLATEKGVGYLDIASIYKDSNGNMADKYSGGDGIHLSPNAYYLWLDYIMENA